MLTRAAAALIDLRLALARAIRRVWRVPGDVLGRLVMGACGVSEPTRRIAVPDLGEVCIVEDPRVGRYLDRAPWPFAETLNVFLARTTIPNRPSATRSSTFASGAALGRCSCRPTASRRWRRCSRARTRTRQSPRGRRAGEGGPAAIGGRRAGLRSSTGSLRRSCGPGREPERPARISTQIATEALARVPPRAAGSAAQGSTADAHPDRRRRL